MNKEATAQIRMTVLSSMKKKQGGMVKHSRWGLDTVAWQCLYKGVFNDENKSAMRRSSAKQGSR